MFPKSIIYMRFKGLFIFPFTCYYRIQSRGFAPGGSSANGNEQSFTEKNDNFESFNKNESTRRIFRRRRSDFSGFYSFVVDDGVADMIAKEVMKSVKKRNKARVFEINPGMGKITKAVMENGLEKITLCEPLSCVLCQEIVEQFKENIEILNMSNNTLTIHHPDDIFPSDFELSKDQQVIIIGINVNRRFIRRLIERVILVDAKYMWNYEFYFLMSEDIYHCFEELCYKHTSLLDYGCIHLVLKMEMLAQFPRSAVLPPTIAENKSMYLLRLRRITPKIPHKHLINYWNFLSIFTMKKKKNVVAVLEKWIPGCGPFLIANGFSVTTSTYELSREDLMTLYNVLLNLENFISAVNVAREEDFLT